jgi:hypothetical protein
MFIFKFIIFLKTYFVIWSNAPNLLAVVDSVYAFFSPLLDAFSIPFVLPVLLLDPAIFRSDEKKPSSGKPPERRANGGVWPSCSGSYFFAP